MALTSNTNVLDVIFHSDESYTDKGFSAEYNAYDPSNRESAGLSNARQESRGVPCDKPAPLKASLTERGCHCS